jgi:hypothetical protein
VLSRVADLLIKDGLTRISAFDTPYKIHLKGSVGTVQRQTAACSSGILTRASWMARI